MRRLGLVLTVVGLLSAKDISADTPKIARAIGRQPVYRTKSPKYGLLSFGPKGKAVWLVLDGDVLYVDRNGNGDLTEPGKRITVERKAGRDPDEDGYSFDVGEICLGGRTHKGLSVSFAPLKLYANGSLGKRADVRAALTKDPKAMAASIAVDADVPGMKGGGIGGRVSVSAGPIDLVGVLQFASRPEDAPVIHLGGPLQVDFYAERPTLRVGRESEFVLVVGTPGIGPGTFAMVSYRDTIPEGANPLARLLLPAAKSGAPPVQDECEIKSRC